MLILQYNNYVIQGAKFLRVFVIEIFVSNRLYTNYCMKLSNI